MAHLHAAAVVQWPLLTQKKKYTLESMLFLYKNNIYVYILCEFRRLALAGSSKRGDESKEETKKRDNNNK
jgi:hypothetical protein